VGSGVHGHHELGIYRLIRMAFGADATDRGDKVYGILGLVHEDIASRVRPDYILSGSEVFAAFTRAVILGTRTLNSRSLSFPKATPSWALDPGFWSLRYHKGHHFIASTGGSRDVERELEFKDNNTVLVCKGVLFNVIDGPSDWLGTAQPMLSIDSSEQFEFPSLGAGNAYGDRLHLTEALWRTLVGAVLPG
jgi:hypothetical protein